MSGGGDTAAARATAGARAWMTTNTSLGTSGANNASGTAATDGTQRTVTEAMVQAVAKSCFDNGGHPDTILLGTSQKQTFSGFAATSTPISQIYNNSGGDSPASMVAAIDVYVKH